MAQDEGKEGIDPLDNLLNLEEQYHSEGYDLGVTDGSRAGRIEGRIFGLEKGFEKFFEMGQLQGRAAIWTAGLSSLDSSQTGQVDASQTPRSERLKKHISRLHDLTDIETLSTENSEDAVADFGDRLKDAKAKTLLVSRILGEEDAMSSTGGILARTQRQGLKMQGSSGGQTTNEMEDFTGIPRSKAA